LSPGSRAITDSGEPNRPFPPSPPNPNVPPPPRRDDRRCGRSASRSASLSPVRVSAAARRRAYRAARTATSTRRGPSRRSFFRRIREAGAGCSERVRREGRGARGGEDKAREWVEFDCRRGGGLV
jgi:hypothetical protein